MLGLFPLAVSGDDVLLATVTLVATSVGTFSLSAAVSPGDLAEGLALDPSGFDTVQFIGLEVRAVPEATGLHALVCSLIGLALFRRSGI